MKKIMIYLVLTLVLCSACGKKATDIVVDPTIEPTIEEINNAKKATAEQTVMSIKKTAQVYYMEQQMKSGVTSNITIDFSGSVPKDFVFSGIMPTEGRVFIDVDGNVEIVNLVINNFKCKLNDNKAICE